MAEGQSSTIIQTASKGPVRVTKYQVANIFNNLPVDQRPDSHAILALVGAAHKREYEYGTSLIGAIICELRRSQNKESSQPTKNQTTDTLPYVLIIDEINRGNISKILGELITLLEPDKRIGGDNELELTLPISGKPFGLPNNLFIIGTMNTADKSLALLDIALRRRFKFEEMPPQFSRCTNLSDSTKQILETLNARITLCKDRDHRIGHSFFIHADDTEFDGIFRSEIIPLLQEYFFNDWKGLRFVFNEKDGDENFIRALAGCDEEGVRNRWQWFFDDGNSSLNCLDQLRVNYQISP